MQNTKILKYTAGYMLLLTFGLFVNACGPLKKSDTSKARATKTAGNFNLQTAMHSADTLRIRQFLAGSWKLDKICRSSFVGLKCDSSIKQTWKLDSLGGISWITEGDIAGEDQYHFVPRAGVQAGTSRGDSAWVLYVNQARRAYLIRSLTKDSLKIADYPLIMDKTTTYYLSR